jgi:antitoxin (DNA-binding transcriptional repressor) of toxin-antitoxin stability system
MTISTFKAHISEELQKVRKGATLMILDRETPVAEVVPVRGKQVPHLELREPTSPYTIPRLKVPIVADPLDALLEDRAKR